MSLTKPRFHIIFRFIAAAVLLTFTTTIAIPIPAYAQSLPWLPIPGAMVTLSDKFTPPLVLGLKIYPDNPLQFGFIVDKGDAQISDDELKTESQRMIKYFMASVTVPEDDIWVNLSPYEEDRMIDDHLGDTEMGRDMLSQDYILKQLTASLIHPQEDLGKAFWDKVYKQVYEKYGTTKVPVNTFNKVWIVNDKSVVYETKDTAFVLENKLKVMLEEDYLAINKNLPNENSAAAKANIEEDKYKELSSVSSQIVRDIIVPAIEKEVNEGKNFANLRQIFNSLVLASWYKQALKESLFSKVYADQNKTFGVDVEDKEVKQKIYNQYIEAFKKGAVNLIKEDFDENTKDHIKRRYFSGGVTFDIANIERISGDTANITPANRLKVARFVDEHGTEGKALTLVDVAAVENAGAKDSANLALPLAADNAQVTEKELQALKAGLGEKGLKYTSVAVWITPDKVLEYFRAVRKVNAIPLLSGNPQRLLLNVENIRKTDQDPIVVYIDSYTDGGLNEYTAEEILTIIEELAGLNAQVFVKYDLLREVLSSPKKYEARVADLPLVVALEGGLVVSEQVREAEAIVKSLGLAVQFYTVSNIINENSEMIPQFADSHPATPVFWKDGDKDTVSKVDLAEVETDGDGDWGRATKTPKIINPQLTAEQKRKIALTRIRGIEQFYRSVGISEAPDTLIDQIEAEVESMNIGLNEISFMVNKSGLVILGPGSEFTPQYFRVIQSNSSITALITGLREIAQTNPEITIKEEGLEESINNIAYSIEIPPAMLKEKRAVLRLILKNITKTDPIEIVDGLKYEPEGLALTDGMARQVFVAEAEEQFLSDFRKSAEAAKENYKELYELFMAIVEGREAKLVLTKELVEKWKLKDDLVKNLLDLARKATAGMRATQNPLNPADLSKPMNILFTLLTCNQLAEMALAQAKKDKIENPQAIIAGEVRFNTPAVNSMLRRRLAAMGFTVHSPKSGEYLPIGATSFITTIEDILMTLYDTSSHAARMIYSSKIMGFRSIELSKFEEEALTYLGEDTEKYKRATSEGAQLLIEQMVQLAEGIQKSINKVLETGEPLVFEFAPASDPRIKFDIDNSAHPENKPVSEQYAGYLAESYLTGNAQSEIKEATAYGIEYGYSQGNGSSYGFNRRVLNTLIGKEAADAIEWSDIHPDSFFSGTGMARYNPKAPKDPAIGEFVESHQVEIDRFFVNQQPGSSMTATLSDGKKVYFQVLHPSTEQSILRPQQVPYIRLSNGNLLAYYAPSLFDASQDVSLLDVVLNSNLSARLKDKPIGFIQSATDPDGDRYVVMQVERNDKETIARLDSLNIAYLVLSGEKILVVYTPNQNFFDIQGSLIKTLKERDEFHQDQESFDEYKEVTFFGISTTVSTSLWRDLWEKHKVPTVLVPVGFKEISRMEQQVEEQVRLNKIRERMGFKKQRVIVHDVFGKAINLGYNPRLLFAGEESGGMVVGKALPMESTDGSRIFLAWREKNAVEANALMLKMISEMFNEARRAVGGHIGDDGLYQNEEFLAGMSLSRQIQEKIKAQNSQNTAELRTDFALVDLMLLTKMGKDEAKEYQQKANARRDANDAFFVSLAFAIEDGSITLGEAKEIVKDALLNDPEVVPTLVKVTGEGDQKIRKTLNDWFDKNLIDILFQGDGTYFQFKDGMFCINRPSGTDPKDKGYPSTNDPFMSALLSNAVVVFNPLEKTPTVWQEIFQEKGLNDLLNSQKVLVRKQVQYERGLQVDNRVPWQDNIQGVLATYQYFQPAPELLKNGIKTSDVLIRLGPARQREAIKFVPHANIAYVSWDVDTKMRALAEDGQKAKFQDVLSTMTVDDEYGKDLANIAAGRDDANLTAAGPTKFSIPIVNGPKDINGLPALGSGQYNAILSHNGNPDESVKIGQVNRFGVEELTKMIKADRQVKDITMTEFNLDDIEDATAVKKALKGMGVEVAIQKAVFIQGRGIRFGIVSSVDIDGEKKVFIETPYWEKIEAMGSPFYMRERKLCYAVAPGTDDMRHVYEKEFAELIYRERNPGKKLSDVIKYDVNAIFEFYLKNHLPLEEIDQNAAYYNMIRYRNALWSVATAIMDGDIVPTRYWRANKNQPTVYEHLSKVINDWKDQGADVNTIVNLINRYRRAKTWIQASSPLNPAHTGHLVPFFLFVRQMRADALNYMITGGEARKKRQGFTVFERLKMGFKFVHNISPGLTKASSFLSNTVLDGEDKFWEIIALNELKDDEISKLLDILKKSSVPSKQLSEIEAMLNEETTAVYTAGGDHRGGFSYETADMGIKKKKEAKHPTQEAIVLESDVNGTITPKIVDKKKGFFWDVISRIDIGRKKHADLLKRVRVKPVILFTWRFEKFGDEMAPPADSLDYEYLLQCIKEGFVIDPTDSQRDFFNSTDIRNSLGFFRTLMGLTPPQEYTVKESILFGRYRAFTVNMDLAIRRLALFKNLNNSKNFVEAIKEVLDVHKKDKWLIANVAENLGVSVRDVRKWMKFGKIKDFEFVMEQIQKSKSRPPEEIMRNMIIEKLAEDSEILAKWMIIEEAKAPTQELAEQYSSSGRIVRDFNWGTKDDPDYKLFTIEQVNDAKVFAKEIIEKMRINLKNIHPYFFKIAKELQSLREDELFIRFDGDFVHASTAVQKDTSHKSVLIHESDARFNKETIEALKRIKPEELQVAVSIGYDLQNLGSREEIKTKINQAIEFGADEISISSSAHALIENDPELLNSPVPITILDLAQTESDEANQLPVTIPDLQKPNIPFYLQSTTDVPADALAVAIVNYHLALPGKWDPPEYDLSKNEIGISPVEQLQQRYVEGIRAKYKAEVSKDVVSIKNTWEYQRVKGTNTLTFSSDKNRTTVESNGKTIFQEDTDAQAISASYRFHRGISPDTQVYLVNPEVLNKMTQAGIPSIITLGKVEPGGQEQHLVFLPDLANTITDGTDVPRLTPDDLERYSIDQNDWEKILSDFQVAIWGFLKAKPDTIYNFMIVDGRITYKTQEANFTYDIENKKHLDQFVINNKVVIQDGLSIRIRENTSRPTFERDIDLADVEAQDRAFVKTADDTTPQNRDRVGRPGQGRPNRHGGIDFRKVDVQIKRDGDGVPLPIEMQDMEHMNIKGFTPVIINVTPIPSLIPLLGLSREEETEEISRLN